MNAMKGKMLLKSVKYIAFTVCLAIAMACFSSCGYFTIGDDSTPTPERPVTTEKSDVVVTFMPDTPYYTTPPSVEGEDSIPVSPVPMAENDGNASVKRETLSGYCRLILQKYGTSIDNIYDYINNSEPAERLYYDAEDSLIELPSYEDLAIYLYENGHGVCYHFASLTYFLLTEAGYEAYIIHGYRNYDVALHYWTMVKVDGKWYHFDPLHHQHLLTDSEKASDEATRGNGVTWEKNRWPVTE